MIRDRVRILYLLFLWFQNTSFVFKHNKLCVAVPPQEQFEKQFYSHNTIRQFKNFNAKKI